MWFNVKICLAPEEVDAVAFSCLQKGSKIVDEKTVQNALRDGLRKHINKIIQDQKASQESEKE